MPRFQLPGLLLPLLFAFPAPSGAQTASPAAPAAARILGTVTAVGDGTVTVHQGGATAGDVVVAITPQTRLLRTAPGETNLKNAQPMQPGDLAVGDRVLIRPAEGADAAHPAAGILVAMKQGDIQQAHAEEAGDWQRRGVAGIVQSVDPGTGPGTATVTLKPQAGAPPLLIHTTEATVIRHYAPDSTSFADAHKASLADIHPGDQLRARGARAEGSPEIAAEEVVDGSFRNISATVESADPAGNLLSIKDLATNKPITLYLEPGTQLRKLPPELAARIAHRQAGAGTGAGAGAGTPSGASASSAPGEAGPAGTRPRGAGDLSGLLQRAPAVTLAELKQGDAVMIVASGPGASRPTAITVIAGVEPLLQGSPEASAGLFSASWNLGGGGADAAGGSEGGSPR